MRQPIALVDDATGIADAIVYAEAHHLLSRLPTDSVREILPILRRHVFAAALRASTPRRRQPQRPTLRLHRR